MPLLYFRRGGTAFLRGGATFSFVAISKFIAGELGEGIVPLIGHRCAFLCIHCSRPMGGDCFYAADWANLILFLLKNESSNHRHAERRGSLAVLTVRTATNRSTADEGRTTRPTRTYAYAHYFRRARAPLIIRLIFCSDERRSSNTRESGDRLRRSTLAACCCIVEDQNHRRTLHVCGSPTTHTHADVQRRAGQCHSLAQDELYK